MRGEGEQEKTGRRVVPEEEHFRLSEAREVE